MDCLVEISKTIDRHRADVFITCEESCWCWDVEAAICAYRDNAKGHSVAAVSAVGQTLRDMGKM